MKKVLIHTLLKSYSLLVIGIVIFFASILSYISWYQYDTNRIRIQQGVADGLKEELDYYQGRVGNYLADYITDRDRLDSLYHYFQLSPSQYQVWLLSHPHLMVKRISLQDSVRTLYLYYPFVEGVDIAPMDANTVFVSTSDLKSGKKVTAENYKAPQHSISMTLFSPSTTEGIATIYVTIDADLLEQYIQRKTDLPMTVRVQDSLDREFYSLRPDVASPPLSYRMSGDLQIAVGVDQQYAIEKVGSLVGIIFLGSSCLVALLLLVLRRVFKRYEVQVLDIVDTMQQIRGEDRHLRLQTDNKEQEMYLISSEINQMLDAMDQSIQDIYRLQLAQKDANMRALQAQINPHFLYNTLEFFRMYAVSKQMDELGDMIYEFSSLLRSSVTQAKMTTVAEELSFCEKHSYICQIRYPRSIAYAYQMDPGCERVEIPRFVIQPLVENYFVHGVDLKRKDNALSVKALKHGQDMEILIRDNGKGMNAETLEAYKHLLASRELSQENRSQSIGLRNVHERLLLYFGDRYQIELDSKEGEGVTYSILFEGVFPRGDEHDA
ncbi:sensor histidine kinase [Streptococcus suis]|uniref:sensor histidine kinase n=1 Tax=Streptococcus suis TaxID=1307 RepID=UPI0025B1996A|nr:sensor histidine kinase [Streptococcus suis]MDN2981556.1 sensor histidine kinase [Streptococcus suis]